MNSYEWICGTRSFRPGNKTLTMGILNATPDSFSDGGRHPTPEAALARALEMAEEGADVIDVGGESTRPGAKGVSAEEEIDRVVPIIRALRARSDVAISIDTMKAETARAALKAGANIVNDVSALSDPEMPSAVVRSGAGLVLMHMRGNPRTMQDDPRYADVIEEVGSFLSERISLAESFGIPREHVVVDPGIGFGKTLEHNLALLRSIPELERRCARPVLIGASRKRIVGRLTGRERPGDRLAGSLGIAAWAAAAGAHILRVHDVIETCDVCRIVDSLGSLGCNNGGT